MFVQVQINFLPVGHTHEDVDQLFSKIGEEIRKTEQITIRLAVLQLM